MNPSSEAATPHPSAIAVPHRHARRHRRPGRAGRVGLSRRRQQAGLDHRSRPARRPPHRRRRHPGLHRAPAERDPGRRARCASCWPAPTSRSRTAPATSACSRCNPTLQGGGIGKVVINEAERIVREDWGLAADAHDRDRRPRRTDRLLRAPRLPPHRHQEAVPVRRRALRPCPSATTCASRCWRRRS